MLIINTIVIIDDMLQNKKLYEHAFKEEFAISIFRSTDIAIREIKKPEMFSSLAIILINLTEKNNKALNALKQIMLDNYASSLPIIMIAPEKDTEGYEGKYFQNGSTDVVYRPLNTSVLLARVLIHTKLFKWAFEDKLTGIYNRRTFDDKIEYECKRSAREGQPISVCMIDVDYFKKYNDSYGHEKGDEVLQDVAKTLSRAVRSTDIVARYGGEEFFVILPNTDEHGARAIAKKIVAAVRTMGIPHKGTELVDKFVTVSVGATTKISNPIPSELIKIADVNLYEAKGIIIDPNGNKKEIEGEKRNRAIFHPCC